LKPIINRTQGESSNHNTTDAVNCHLDLYKDEKDSSAHLYVIEMKQARVKGEVLQI